ncbi:MAG: DUF2127 domain-containing protein [Patescibacteria group bacterium]|nr:DUF2127 domain-containing protein [Patescibacteria group bacterium]
MKFKISEHNIFLASILLKGLNGVAEIVGGLLIIAFRPATVISLVDFLTQNEISEDPRDIIANYLIHSFQNYSPGLQFFWSAYFLIHGLIKVFLVVALLGHRLWAYPAAISVFALFIVYQLYRFSFGHSPFLIILSLFDIFVIIMTYLEYQRIRKPLSATENS